jgi:hypothetical protein
VARAREQRLRERREGALIALITLTRRMRGKIPRRYPRPVACLRP